MVKNLVKPWGKRLALKKISIWAIALSVVLLVTLAGFSIYGNNVGNFVVGIEEASKLSLTLSEDGTFGDKSSTSNLSAGGMSNATNATYGNIPKNIDEGYGNKSDEKGKKYFAYSFSLKNTSSIAVSYNMQLVITDMYKNVDDALRIMIITDGVREIYAKPKADGTKEEHLDITNPYTTTPFLSATTVCSLDTTVFNKNQIVKYTVVLWLEGYDEQCTDEIKGGAIKMSMQFAAR